MKSNTAPSSVGQSLSMPGCYLEGPDVSGGPGVNVSVVALGFILDSCVSGDDGSETFCVMAFDAEIKRGNANMTQVLIILILKMSCLYYFLGISSVF